MSAYFSPTVFLQLPYSMCPITDGGFPAENCDLSAQPVRSRPHVECVWGLWRPTKSEAYLKTDRSMTGKGRVLRHCGNATRRRFPSDCERQTRPSSHDYRVWSLGRMGAR